MRAIFFRICGNESQPGLQLVKKLAMPLVTACGYLTHVFKPFLTITRILEKSNTKKHVIRASFPNHVQLSSPELASYTVLLCSSCVPAPLYGEQQRQTADWQVKEVNIVVKCFNRFPISKL